MTWSDHNKMEVFIQKIEDGEVLTKQETLEVLLLLMKDYWERFHPNSFTTLDLSDLYERAKRLLEKEKKG